MHDGRHGAMYIGELEDLLAEHAFRQNWWVKTKTHYTGNRLPSGNATLFFGPPPPPEYDEEEWKMDKWFENHGDHYNIPIPYLPERTVRNEKGRMTHRSWRGLLQQLITSGHVRPDPKLRSVLGDEAFERARRRALSNGRYV